MRSRQHVVIARLNDEEYAAYKRIILRIRRAAIPIKNDSEGFRLALRVISQELHEESIQYFYDSCLDIGVDLWAKA